ncbi:cyclic nucleotide-gated channel cone photoreceptor subunit alpha-like, partial [Oncorhynchus keta]|uniref:cyclic nucleotide-gated channel cone photoreceptor subunit alpha-like n=1 Tax=Oncorhynchus keta TaxID=8018 RepID=UPI00227A8648
MTEAKPFDRSDKGRMNRWARVFRWHRMQKEDDEEEKKEDDEEEKKEEGKDEKKLPAKPKVNWTEWVVDPSEEFYYGWLQVMIFPIFYNWIIIICRTCFKEIEDEFLTLWLTLDYFSDLLYVADTIIKFRT